jgi:hypothetical protein
MKYLVPVAAFLFVFSAFGAAGKSVKDVRKPASLSFSDGSTVEMLNLNTPNSPIDIIQIKDSRGKNCYGIASAMGGNNAGNGASVTCVP